MQNVFACSTSARFAVIEFVEELNNKREDELCAFHTTVFIDKNRAERYADIKARYDIEPYFGSHITSDEYWFMRDYEEEQWRNSEAYQNALEWLADPTNRSDENYSDIYKDVYGFRPR